MSNFLSNEINTIYKELLNQFNNYKDTDFIFTSYLNNNINNFGEISKKYLLLNEIDTDTNTQFNNYYFISICRFDALEFVDWAYKKNKDNEKNLKEFGKEGQGCFVLKIKIKSIVSMRYNFWPYTNIKEDAYINILVNHNNVSYNTNLDGNIYNVNFDKTFLDFYLDNDNDIILGNDNESTNIYTFSYDCSKEDTRIHIIDTSSLDMSKVYKYLNKKSNMDINTAKSIVYNLLEEGKIDELMELENLIVSILSKR